MMNKTVYETVAQAMKEGYEEAEGERRGKYSPTGVRVKYHICKKLMRMFEKDNPKFDPVKFWRACGWADGGT